MTSRSCVELDDAAIAAQQGHEADAALAALHPRSLGLVRWADFTIDNPSPRRSRAARLVESVNDLANPTARGALTIRARAIARVAYERGVLLRVPAPVLAEVRRGSRFDAAVNQLLNREAIGVADLTREIAQAAGALLAKARLSSAHAIDAFVVATALDFDTAVIAT